ncbi:hypothetical protein MJ585_28620 [Klebsiella pneumoniae]|nr:hypothetical protein MJ585_28620 [Klebsiella pneumoniae]
MAFDDSQKWVNFFSNTIYFAPRPGNKASTATTSFFPMTKRSSSLVSCSIREIMADTSGVLATSDDSNFEAPSQDALGI